MNVTLPSQAMKAFFATSKHNYSLFVLRLVAAGVMLPHGLQKTVGWFGGNGFDATMGFFTSIMGIPAALAFLVIMAESVGAIAMIVGFCTRLCAFGMAAVMTGAVLIAHANNGFFMNWGGNLNGEGYEYHILYLGILFVLFVWGGGALSLDTRIAAALTKAKKPAVAKKVARKKK